jgi:cytochrome c
MPSRRLSHNARGVVAAAALLAACGDRAGGDRAGAPLARVAGGDAVRGAHALVAYGCGSCHVIPGIDGASGSAAAPLDAFGRRTTIAGEAINAPDQLVAWIMHPQAIAPGTAMPDLGVRTGDARDIAAYLYTLR